MRLFTLMTSFILSQPADEDKSNQKSVYSGEDHDVNDDKGEEFNFLDQTDGSSGAGDDNGPLSHAVQQHEKGDDRHTNPEVGTSEVEDTGKSSGDGENISKSGGGNSNLNRKRRQWK